MRSRIHLRTCVTIVVIGALLASCAIYTTHQIDPPIEPHLKTNLVRLTWPNSTRGGFIMVDPKIEGHFLCGTVKELKSLEAINNSGCMIEVLLTMSVPIPKTTPVEMSVSLSNIVMFRGYHTEVVATIIKHVILLLVFGLILIMPFAETI